MLRQHPFVVSLVVVVLGSLQLGVWSGANAGVVPNATISESTYSLKVSETLPGNLLPSYQFMLVQVCLFHAAIVEALP